MDLWQEILNTALLGTDKRMASTEGLPTDLQGVAGLIVEGKASDKEEQFYNWLHWHLITGNAAYWP
ncbi:hypothetical protein [Paraflavitalea speifideaquila]|uniref:hypothetical protein n=1 Tax=Paraflavitalea speifideaquila TaxID=3076558 RepID=UPI0028F11747|nr:hypothetical protein [Paraflavitalea speifideiaquila]